MFLHPSVILFTGRGMRGRGRRAWGGVGRGACVAGETTTEAGRTHPTGMHSSPIICFPFSSIFIYVLFFKMKT